jgi:hypothetical protein
MSVICRLSAGTDLKYSMADLLGIVAESHPVCSFNWQDYFAGRFKKNWGLHPGS